MAKTNNNKKRKSNAPPAGQLPNKLAKNVTTITPPPENDDATSVEPRSIQTVISEEELEITVDTLNTLAKYPGLIKSKQCKDLRVAVYDFRQACQTGVNTARESFPFLRPRVPLFPGFSQTHLHDL